MSTRTSFAMEVPQMDQGGLWNNDYKPIFKDFAINHPWNQKQFPGRSQEKKFWGEGGDKRQDQDERED